MGTNVLPERPGGVPIPTAWFNDIRQLVLGDFVPRNSSGIPTNLAGDLGTLLFQWKTLRAESIFLNGNPLETTFLTGRSWRVEDGTKKASGFPNYLVPAGVGNGLNATIDATEDFRGLANGTSIVIQSNTVFSSLTAAPSTNNTALVDDSDIAGGDETKYLGELDSKFVTIDAIGTEISDRDGEFAAFRTPAGEVFLALIDTTNSRVFPIVRGWAGTERDVLSNNDSLELLQINTLLFSNDGNTKVSSPNYPESVDAFPAAGNSEKVYIERTGAAQGYDDGVSIIQDYLIVGFAVCDDTDCLYAEQIDFDLSWNNTIDLGFQVMDAATVQVNRGATSGIKSTVAEFFNAVQFDTTLDLEAGESLTDDTELYLYLDDSGSIIFSHKIPRKYGFLKRGLYHPKEYWRAVGSVMLGSGGAIDFKKKETPNREAISGMLPPIGTILPMVGSYFGNGSNGSPTRVMGTSVADINRSIPDNWAVCDGSELTDPESDIYRLAGRFLPNLTDDRFLRGNNSLAGVGGAATVTLSTANMPSHTHTINHGHTSSISNAANANHSHSAGDSSASNDLKAHVYVTGNPGKFAVQTPVQTGNDSFTANFEWPTSLGLSSAISTVTSSSARISGFTRSESGGSTPSVNVVSHSGNSGSQGSGSSFNIVPKYMDAIHIIRIK
jgi:microcystin-dependent protein